MHSCCNNQSQTFAKLLCAALEKQHNENKLSSVIKKQRKSLSINTYQNLNLTKITYITYNTT